MQQTSDHFPTELEFFGLQHIHASLVPGYHYDLPSCLGPRSKKWPNFRLSRGGLEQILDMRRMREYAPGLREYAPEMRPAILHP